MVEGLSYVTVLDRNLRTRFEVMIPEKLDVLAIASAIKDDELFINFVSHKIWRVNLATGTTQDYKFTDYALPTGLRISGDYLLMSGIGDYTYLLWNIKTNKIKKVTTVRPESVYYCTSWMYDFKGTNIYEACIQANGPNWRLWSGRFDARKVMTE